jgi:hypothetical protein
MASTVTSKGIHINGYNNATIVNGAIQAIFSGSPTGTIKLQISCDNVAVPLQANNNNPVENTDPAVNVVNWCDYSGSPQTISGAGIFIWNFFNPGYRWLRVVYTPSGGSGALTVQAVLKRTSMP